MQQQWSERAREVLEAPHYHVFAVCRKKQAEPGLPDLFVRVLLSSTRRPALFVVRHADGSVKTAIHVARSRTAAPAVLHADAPPGALTLPRPPESVRDFVARRLLQTAVLGLETAMRDEGRDAVLVVVRRQLSLLYNPSMPGRPDPQGAYLCKLLNRLEQRLDAACLAHLCQTDAERAIVLELNRMSPVQYSHFLRDFVSPDLDQRLAALTGRDGFFRRYYCRFYNELGKACRDPLLWAAASGSYESDDTDASSEDD